MDVQERNRRALAAVQERRDQFYEGILGLERAMAAPAGDDPAGWAADLRAAVDRMADVLASHVTETEAPDGFYADIVAHHPELWHAAERLRAEHRPLAAALGALGAALDDVVDDDGVEAVREQALDAIKALLHHRHRGAELVYDAYNTDLAPGD